MDFGVMFFSSEGESAGRGRYHLLLEAAKLADRNGFCSVWTPERHFHSFGGLFPNPSVVSAALAMVTERIQLRAGSLVSPLHDTLRIAEEWSVVDNLSGGRVALSFGSGWNIEDFVFQPDRYDRRQAIMYRQIEEVRALWRGEPVLRQDSRGREVAVAIHPRPVQAELPVWVTSSGNVRTFESAGALGTNLLTHLIGQTIEQMGDKVRLYRAARVRAGFDPYAGRVSLMLHTFLGEDLDEVRARIRTPFREYLRSAVSLEQIAALGGGAVSGGHRVATHDIPHHTLEELLDLAFERYVRDASLIGTVESCAEMVARLEEAGIDEIACLVDFVPDAAAVLESLTHAGRLRASLAGREEQARASMAGFLEDL